MAKSSGSFPPGKSGNPSGRPPKSRALTELVLAAGAKKCSDGKGGQIEKRKLLADMIWSAAISGQVTFHASNREWGSSQTFDFRAADWFRFLEWLFDHVDGSLTITMREESAPVENNLPAGTDNAPMLYLPENGRPPQQEAKDAEPPDST